CRTPLPCPATGGANVAPCRARTAPAQPAGRGGVPATIPYQGIVRAGMKPGAAVIRDVAIGLPIAGAVGAWVPSTFWQHLFLTGIRWPPSCGGAHRPGDLGAQLRL